MKLVSVYSVLNAPAILYCLLSERTANQSISHRRMPTAEEHIAFYIGRPYESWRLIHCDDRYVGAVYLTKQCEIGVSIFHEFLHRGYGRMAVELLLQEYVGKRLLANINPANQPSIDLFESLGFKHIQNTYEKEA